MTPRGIPTTLADKLAQARAELKAKGQASAAHIPPTVVKCETCQDLGFVRHAIEDIHHPLFGKLAACPACRQGAAAPPNFEGHGLTPSELNLGWTSILRLEGYNTYDAIGVISRVLRAKYGWVYLHGTYGLGKSDLLKIAVARCLQQGVDAMYRPTEFLVQELRETPPAEFSRLLSQYIHIPVLALDEFEKITHTAWADTKLFSLLDERYRYATQRVGRQGVTLFAANVPHTALNDRALISRLSDERFERFELRGSDVRKVSKQF